MKQILIVEDDEMLNAGLCYNIQAAEFYPIPAYDLKTADEILINEKIDLILLDVNLPDGDGFSYARKLKNTNNTPFIFLTAHDLDEEIISGLKYGADDYITKPFNIKVLIQRIQAVLRRCEKNNDLQVFVCGNLSFDFESGIVKKSEEILSLTPTELKLLKVFCKNAGHVLTKQVLLEKIWDIDANFVDEHTLTINISRLRSKISDSRYSYIKTVYGVGYKWIGEKNES